MNAGEVWPSELITPQKSFSAISAERTLLAWERPLRLGGDRAANLGQNSTVELQAIAHIVQPDRMRYLGLQQRDDMAPIRKFARFLRGTRFARYFRSQMARNEVANLFENSEF